MATAASANGTIITSPPNSPSIKDSNGNVWTLSKSNVGLQIACNGITDTATAYVIRLSYANGKIYQENIAKNWYVKTASSTATWSQTPSQPTNVINSITSEPNTPRIIDANGNTWTLSNSGSVGLQIACNSVIDTATQYVTKVEYYNGSIYQENVAGNWYVKSASATASWSQTSAPGATIITPTPTPTPSSAVGVQARSSDSFVESVGINWGYAEPSVFPTGSKVLLDLGVRYIRGRTTAAGLNALTRSQAMVNGVRVLINIGDANGDFAGYVSQIQSTLASNPGSIDCIEGTNEPDNGGGGQGSGQTGCNAAVANQRAFFNAAKGTLVANIKYASPPLAQDGGGSPGVRQLLSSSEGGTSNSSITGYYNVISGHWGYTGNQPEYDGWLAGSFTDLVNPLQTGNFPIYVTEAGTMSTPDGSNNAWSTWAAEAIYLPRLYMYFFANGVARLYKYCLFQYVGNDNPNWFGLINEYGDDSHPAPTAPPLNTTIAKPAYFALKNLIQLTTDPAPNAGIDTFVPGKLNYTLSGATFAGPTGLAPPPKGNSNIYHTVLGKRNGSFVICLWQYQTKVPAQSPGTFSPINVTITVSGVSHYQTATLSVKPTMNTWGSVQSISGGSVTVPVTDALTLIQFS